MESLLKSLPAIVKAASDSNEVVEAACFVAWKQIIGAGLRGNAVPLRLNERTLTVAVADTVWKKQMESLSGQLLFRLNSMLGQPVVTFLEFHEAPEAIAEARRQLINVETPHAAAPVPQDLLTAAAQIQDGELRSAFLGAAASCIKRVESS